MSEGISDNINQVLMFHDKNKEDLRSIGERRWFQTRARYGADRVVEEAIRYVH
jgi:hypothetical protein